MKKLMCLVVLVLVILSYPVSSMAKISNMKLTEDTDRSLHVYSETENDEVIVSINDGLVTMNLNSLESIGCESGYTTGVRFKFDSNESFGVPLYCSESKVGSVYSSEPHFVEKLVYNLRKYYVLRVFVPGSFGVVTFDLIGFIYLHDSNF